MQKTLERTAPVGVGATYGARRTMAAWADAPGEAVQRQRARA